MNENPGIIEEERAAAQPARRPAARRSRRCRTITRKASRPASGIRKAPARRSPRATSPSTSTPASSRARPTSLKVEDFWDLAPDRGGEEEPRWLIAAPIAEAEPVADGLRLSRLTPFGGSGARAALTRAAGDAARRVPQPSADAARSFGARALRSPGNGPGAFRSARPSRPSARRWSALWSMIADFSLIKAFGITLQPLVLGLVISAVARHRDRRRHGPERQGGMVRLADLHHRAGGAARRADPARSSSPTASG